MAQETFVIRTHGGPYPGNYMAPGPWPLPEELPATGGHYVKVRESQLPKGSEHVLRGAEYEWRPDA